MWSSIWSVATTRIGFWIWIWSLWTVDFNAGETQLVSFDWSNNTGTINVKMDGSILKGKSSLKMLGWLSLLSWIGALTLPLLLKLPPKKLEPWFVLWRFFLLRFLCVSINLPYGHAWTTVVMSGLVLLVVTCYLVNRYVWLLVLHLLPLLNPWVIVKM